MEVKWCTRPPGSGVSTRILHGHMGTRKYCLHVGCVDGELCARVWEFYLLTRSGHSNFRGFLIGMNSWGHPQVSLGIVKAKLFHLQCSICYFLLIKYLPNSPVQKLEIEDTFLVCRVGV
jgi:hypothetical protein